MVRQPPMYSPILARGRTIAGNLARKARGLDKGKTAQVVADVVAFGVGSYLGLKSLFLIVQKDWLSPKWATVALSAASGAAAWALWRKLQTMPAKAAKRKAYRAALASVVGYGGAAVYSGITLAENSRMKKKAKSQPASSEATSDQDQDKNTRNAATYDLDDEPLSDERLEELQREFDRARADLAAELDEDDS